MTVAAGCGITEDLPEPPSRVTFRLHNDGAQSVYLFEDCVLDYTITALADPVHSITRLDGCACACGQSSCPVCGPCAHSAIEVLVGMSQPDVWTAVDFTTEATPAGSCVRQKTLPPGPYRIDVPVYPTADDAAAGIYARTATQSFTLPIHDGFVDVALGVSP